MNEPIVDNPKHDYVLTLRVRIEGCDDIEARRLAQQAIIEVGLTQKLSSAAKLQEIFTDKAPRKIDL